MVTSKNKKKTGDKNLPSKLETVLFAPHTPGGELRRILQKVDTEVMGDRKFGRVKVVEHLGDKLISSLGNKAPWKNEECSRPHCLPCREKPGSCRSRNASCGCQALMASRQQLCRQKPGRW